MKIINSILAIVCSLSLSAAGQNAVSSEAAGCPGNSVEPGGKNYRSVTPGSGGQHRNIGPGLNNPDLNTPNYRNKPNGRDGMGGITNGFGSGVITNRFGSGIITNGFGDGGITNAFGEPTNGFGSRGVYGGYGSPSPTNLGNAFGYTNGGTNYFGYTNLYYRNPYATDPRVMGNGSLNNTN